MAASFKHGTLTAYRNHGCRCDRCRDAGMTYMREYRARRRAASDFSAHGSETTYSLGCRCDDCRTAHATYNRARYAASRGAR